MRAGVGRVGERLALGARWDAGDGALGWADAVGRTRHERDQVGYEWDRAHDDRDQAQRERGGSQQEAKQDNEAGEHERRARGKSCWGGEHVGGGLPGYQA